MKKKKISRKSSLFGRLYKNRNLLIVVVIFAFVGVGTLVYTYAASRPTYSIQSGAWSNPQTWQNKQVPRGNIKVIIRSGHVVVADSNSKVSGIEIDKNAELKYSGGKSVQLQSNKNVIVRGKLTMTPNSNRQVHKLQFVEVNNDSFKGSGMDPIASDVGLWVVDSGQLSINGTPKTGWTNLAHGVNSKAISNIKLKTTPTNWQTGDQIFIAPTEPPIESTGDAPWKGFDDSTLLSTSRDLISLSTPLRRAHPQVNNRWTAEVANLSRNVQIMGTEKGYSHVFIRSTKPQTIRYAELMYMGTPDKNKQDEEVLGRYAIHFHHSLDGSKGSNVEGVSVHKGLNHAFVPHASNGIRFYDTVSYDTRGDAYWWDKTINKKRGDQEVVNNDSSNIIFDHTMAAKVAGDGNTSTSGYRLSEGNEDTNQLTNSVAVGVEGHTQSSGFGWKQGTTTWKFENNIAHNNKINGIFVWQNDQRPHIISNFDAYYNRNGLRHGAYKNQYKYRNINLYGNSSTGLKLEATSNKDSLRFDNINIDGAGITQIGINSCCHQLPGYNYPTVISNGTVKNVTYGVLMDGGQGLKAGDWLQLNNVSVSAQTPYYMKTNIPVNASLEIINRGGQHVCYTPTSLRPSSRFIASANAWLTPMTTAHSPGTETSSGC